MESEAGICAPGSDSPKSGIKIKLAPPPHKALREKANSAQTNNMRYDKI